MGTICRHAKLNQWLYSPTTGLFISLVLYSCGGECCVGCRFPIRIMSEAIRELEFVPATDFKIKLENSEGISAIDHVDKSRTRQCILVIGDRRFWFCGSQSKDPQDNSCNSDKERGDIEIKDYVVLQKLQLGTGQPSFSSLTHSGFHNDIR